MVNMKNLWSSLVLVAGVSLFSAQQTRNVGEFNSLKVYDRIPVELVQASKAKVEVLGSNETDVEVVNKNGELKIRMTASKIMQGSDTKVVVYYENLNDIQASQGATISSNDKVKSSMLKLTANEGSKINLEVNADRLNAKGNSGGEILVSGKSKSQDIVMNSGAKFNGSQLQSSNATVASNAGGEVQVYASESISATTRAGGRIDVYGDPDDRNVKKVVGGTINFK